VDILCPSKKSSRYTILLSSDTEKKSYHTDYSVQTNQEQESEFYYLQRKIVIIILSTKKSYCLQKMWMETSQEKNNQMPNKHMKSHSGI
jgi:hypothetical protein